MAKPTAKDKDKSAAELGFEEAMARLEGIVEAMQSPDLPLDQIIERYEEGMKLIEVCEARLEAAEKKIELLSREKSGKFIPVTAPGAASVAADDASGSSSPDEVSLF